jgi:hypothetical protein
VCSVCRSNISREVNGGSLSKIMGVGVKVAQALLFAFNFVFVVSNKG